MARQTLIYAFRDAVPDRQVLLGTKLSGFGAGKVMGLGGHVEPGESDLDAAIREAEEEAGIKIDPNSTVQRATLVYRFPSRPEWDATVSVFIAGSWSGEPTPSDEIRPDWYSVADLPLERMWDDEQYWLPRVLVGEALNGEFTFDASGSRVEHHRVVVA